MPKKDMALSDTMWQYRDVLFDLDTRMLRLAAGESIVERIDNVEDTKGNNGDRGLLRITNLRLIWHAVAVPRINLSIGHNTITGITTRVAKSKIRGQAESLYIMSKGISGTKFEFVFTCVNPSSTKFFSTVIGINRAYESSRMYREMKMRTTLLNSEEKLILLSLETQCDRIDGVWNLSSDQGNLGIMIITNIRVVWYAALNPQYNVSIPYLQLKSCRIRDSRFGHALVLDTSLQSGEYILGFQVKPEERLEHTCKTIQALLNAFQSSPVFGVQYSRQDVGGMSGDVFTEPPSIPQETEEKEPLEKPLRVDAFAAYFSDGPINGSEPRAIVYSEELGVAIEQLKPGFTISDLWEINLD
uniref:Bardet-Biedl syndrome 5 protein homolog n=1 Tax=Meloidogyne floridensis TaxID=298350 RepID=A0A915PCW3_9BILA